MSKERSFKITNKKINGYKVEYGNLVAKKNSVYCNICGYISSNVDEDIEYQRRRLVSDIRKYVYKTSGIIFDGIDNNRNIVIFDACDVLNKSYKYFDIEMHLYFYEDVDSKSFEFIDKMTVMVQLITEFIEENRYFSFKPSKR